MAVDSKDAEPKEASNGTHAATPVPAPVTTDVPKEFDDFGLPIRKFIAPPPQPESADPEKHDATHDETQAADDSKEKDGDATEKAAEAKETHDSGNESDDADFKDAQAVQPDDSAAPSPTKLDEQTVTKTESDNADFKDTQAVQPDDSAAPSPTKLDEQTVTKTEKSDEPSSTAERQAQPTEAAPIELASKSNGELASNEPTQMSDEPLKAEAAQQPSAAAVDAEDKPVNGHTRGASTASATTGHTKNESKHGHTRGVSTTSATTGEIKHGHTRGASTASVTAAAGISEYSHQQAPTHEEEEKDEDDGWQEMPAYAPYDMYDDDNRLIARERIEEEEMDDEYAALGGAGKGYTRVIMDEDAQSATSMDDHTQYLFKNPNGTSAADGDDDEARDAMSQMQATKDLLTEGQRIAYVGVVRLEIANMVKEAEAMDATKGAKKYVNMCIEAMKMWGQKMMMRVYAHMDISEAEQVMIEQLGEHGVMPADLTPALLANSRVPNPMAEEPKKSASPAPESPPPYLKEEEPAGMPPPYEAPNGEELPEVKTPSQLPTTQKLDIDLRWTVLCDIFLVLIADSVYDARSRVLLERVGNSLDISWLDICKFEKRVTDALEMQQAAEKENWNEEEHMENRRKLALKKRYIMMGLATVGGGLVIGLSAGLLAPVIGAGLAAGFTTIGVTGTGSFLAGAGGAALITSGAAASGGFIGGKAANRRTGAVRTFEYRPLHNNKRVNLIITVSGWLTGKVDDVRLPYSTVDPIMGDIYSVLWEPEMLRSMGDTINILATEALTQGLQQVLGSTILISLMAAIQLPVVLTKLSYLIDNPWAVSLDRATSAGLILADSLIERNLGTRPITLVGYSLGSRVIYSCLQELARKGAVGLVQNVYMFGSPVVVKRDEYLRAGSVVSGRFVNGYNRNDWILGYLFRLTNGGIRRIAGLAAIEDLPFIENMDVTELVPGHMEYRTAMPMLLLECGWEVTSPEFSEIEDPDPENHGERQRELINEIEEARKELEKEGKASKRTSRFGFFGRRKKGDRQEWEIYEDSKKNGGKGGGEKDGNGDGQDGNNHGILFDVDAIRAELAKEAHTAGEEEFQVKEIKSTLPPMKLDFSPAASPMESRVADRPGMGRLDARESWRGSRSAEVLPTRFSNDNGAARAVSSTRASPGNFSTSTSAYHYEQPQRDAEPEIQMTFDTSFDEPKRHQPILNDGLTRPEMRTAQTVPNVTLADPWNDPDDEEFGKEQEISMTFA